MLVHGFRTSPRSNLAIYYTHSRNHSSVEVALISCWHCLISVELRLTGKILDLWRVLNLRGMKIRLLLQPRILWSFQLFLWIQGIIIATDYYGGWEVGYRRHRAGNTMQCCTLRAVENGQRTGYRRGVISDCNWLQLELYWPLSVGKRLQISTTMTTMTTHVALQQLISCWFFLLPDDPEWPAKLIDPMGGWKWK